MAHELTRRDLVIGTGAVAGSLILPEWVHAQASPEKPVGWAVLGLGGYALGQMIPALRQCTKSKLVAVISGSQEKANRVASENGLAPGKAYTYDTMDRIAEDPEIEVVYVITPPGTHRRFTEQAARLGKHVCCEKPMAPSVADCQAMIDACRKAKKLLQIGYRCHYEPYNMKAMELCRNGELGQILTITSEHGFSAPRGTWRTTRALSGGGSMMDIGIYALQAARYLSGEEPTEVFAQASAAKNDDRFKEVEDTLHLSLKFPGGALANLSSGYSWANYVTRYTVLGTNGRIDAEPATGYGGHRFTYRGRPLTVVPANHFAAQMDHFSECIRTGKPVRTPGEMGLQDIKIINAAYESARTGKPVSIQ